MVIRKRRKFTLEFKADSVRLCERGGKTIAEVSKQFDVTEKSLRAWVKQASIDAAPTPVEQLTTAERMELGELRRRVKRLKMERDILKKATAFFARESA